MITVPAGVHIYLACGITDMRKGFDSLSLLAQEVSEAEPVCGPPVCLSGAPGRSDQNPLLGWPGLLPVRQAAGEGPVHLAGDEGGGRDANTGAALDAARGP